VKLDLLSFIEPIVVIGPHTFDEGAAPIVSPIIDTQGFEELLLLCTGGGWLAPGTATILVEHGEVANGSDMAPAPDAFLYHDEANATVTTADTIRRVGYRCATGKRYVRVTVTVSAVVADLAPGYQFANGNVFDTNAFFVGIVMDQGIHDTNGYGYVNLGWIIGVTGGLGPWTAHPEIRHSDNQNFSGGVAVPDSLLDALETTLEFGTGDDGEARRIGYFPTKTGGKRYVRVRCDTFSGTWDGDSIFTAGGGATYIKPPVSAGYEVVGLLVSLRTVEGGT